MHNLICWLPFVAPIFGIALTIFLAEYFSAEWKYNTTDKLLGLMLISCWYTFLILLAATIVGAGAAYILSLLHKD